MSMRLLYWQTSIQDNTARYRICNSLVISSTGHNESVELFRKYSVGHTQSELRKIKNFNTYKIFKYCLRIELK